MRYAIVEINANGCRVVRVGQLHETRTARWRRHLYALGMDLANSGRPRPRHPSAGRGFDVAARSRRAP